MRWAGEKERMERGVSRLPRSTREEVAVAGTRGSLVAVLRNGRILDVCCCLLPNCLASDFRKVSVQECCPLQGMVTFFILNT